jgi:putative ABC transport system permease protein
MLFGEGVDPTGVEIRIRNQIFRVLGVMASKGAQAGGMNQDDQVFAPFTTVMKRMQGTDFLNQLLVSARSADNIAAASAAVSAELRAAHELGDGALDDFRLLTQDDIVALRTQTTETMTSLMAGVAGVSLVVGGIGIMNIMLVSVAERTREIGLRLAIGAKGGDVLKQFLVEAVVISLLGGAIGVATGWGAAAFMRAYQEMPASVPLGAIIASVGFSAGVGIFFGFYPAMKAAALDPITALKFE